MNIDKLAWIEIQDRKVLFVRTKGQELFYTPGGKREKDETDVEALARELKEELSVKLIPDSATFLHEFEGPAHNKPEGTMMHMRCFTARCEGMPQPSSEIDELTWLSSKDTEKTTVMGKTILLWLKEQNLID